ncbi:hypothetical protein [Nonomuraea sp. NPDC001023]|uniref:hypothetical protein n=1 Tax=unclassified Nonomuraea TaxID=2593643 RepID=UPI00332FEE3B
MDVFAAIRQDPGNVSVTTMGGSRVGVSWASMGLLIIASQGRLDRFPRGVGVQVDPHGAVQTPMPPDQVRRSRATA